MAAFRRNPHQTSLFGPLYAYLVIVSPPENIKAAIAKIKAEMQRIIGIGDRNMHSIPHITLTEKLTDDKNLVQVFASLLNGQPCTNITVKGWGFFDHGHSITIYLNIIKSSSILNLCSLFKQGTATPHITLAKKIPHKTFTTLLPYLEKLEFEANWNTTEVTVLRKLMTEKHLGFREKFSIPLRC